MDALAVLGDLTRRRLVELLATGERTAGQLAAEFDSSRPAVSRHLRLLREAGLVSVRSEATRRVYALQLAPLAEIDAWLSRYRALWQQRLDALDTEIRRGQHG
jgi:DNA-binding transcriptional ArsR family regulator